MILPQPWLTMCGSTARATRNTPRTLTAITRSHSSSEVSSTVPTPAIPALLNRTSIRPKASTTRATAASHEAWPVSRLAHVSGVSAAHFARSFKQAFGVPPHRYLLTRRIERATALLRDSDLSITEIAFQTGWGSLGTFGRTFRDITGESPGETRVRTRAEAQELGRVPGCIVSAMHRPGLTIAVSEKRRREEDGQNQPQDNEERP